MATTQTLPAALIAALQTFVAASEQVLAPAPVFTIDPAIHTERPDGSFECAKHGTFTESCGLCLAELQTAYTAAQTEALNEALQSAKALLNA